MECYKNIEINLDKVPEVDYVYRNRHLTYKSGVYLPNKKQVVEIKSPENIYPRWKKYLERWKAYINKGYSLRIMVYKSTEPVIDQTVNSLKDIDTNGLPLVDTIRTFAYKKS